MKKRILFLTIFFLSIIGSASAQTEKGTYYTGGSLLYTYNGAGTTTLYNYATGYTEYTNDKISTLQLSPEIGYFISKKWSIGIQANYSRVGGTETSAFTSNNTNVVPNSITTDTYHTDVAGLTLYVRYYCMLTDKIAIFPEFGISSQNDLKNFSNGELTVLASPNLVFFATKKLGVQMGFGNITFANNYHFNNSFVNVGLNNALTFGLNYYWGGK